MSKRRLLVSLAVLLTSAAESVAQAEITHTYGFTQGRTVVTEKIGSNPAMIVEGAGAGIFVLDGTNLEPEPPESGEATELRAGGLVRDLYLTDDHVYAAVHRGGVARFVRGSTNPEPEWITGDDPDIADAWAVDVPVRVGGVDLVFVGTNDDYDPETSATGGMLHLLWADASADPDPPMLQDSLPLGAPIFSLASRVEDNVVTLLVGTACRQPTGGTYESLLRYDFDITSQLPTSFPTPVTWNPTVSGSTVPTFIRDIVIDIEPGDDAAYVASYTRGVYKVTVPSGPTGGLSTASGSWPITAGTGLKSYFQSLALHDGTFGEILVVGMGPTFRLQTTEWGACTYFEPCDDFTGHALERFGVALYDVSQASPTAVGSLIRGSLKPLGLSVYERSGALVIAAASFTAGLDIIEATPASGGFTLNDEGAWDVADEIPTSQFDGMVVLGSNAYVGFEHGLAAFDITEVGGQPADDLFFEGPVDVESGGAVYLAGCAAELGFPTMIFAANLDNINLFEIEGDGPTAQIANRGVIHLGTGIRTYSIGAIPASQTPDGYPWMIAVNTIDPTNPKTCGQPPDPSPGLNGSIRILRVGLDQNNHISPATTVELGAFTPDPCLVSSGVLFGVHYVIGEPVALYVGYAPRTLLYVDEPDAGLLLLHATFQPNSAGEQDDAVDVVEFGRVPVFEEAAAVESNTGAMSYGVVHGALAVTFGCHGIATFSLSSPENLPAIIDSWPTEGSSPTSFLSCAHGPDAIYAPGFDGRIYRFDWQDMSGGPIDVFELQDLGAFIVPAESTGTGDPPPPAFFMTGFRSGIHRIQYLANP